MTGVRAGTADRSLSGVARSAFLTACLAALGFLWPGCGYRLLGPTPGMEISSLHVAGVVNRTTEPRLEDLLHRALVEELLRDRRVRIVSASEAAATLQAVVTAFEVRATAESGDRVTQYEIRLLADFRVTETSTGRVLREIVGLAPPIRETFPVGADVTTARAGQEKAEEEACRALARELASRILLP